MPSAVIVLEQGMRITPFVSPWSTTDRIESCPWLGGRLVMKSADIFAKGLLDFGPSIGAKGATVERRRILNC